MANRRMFSKTITNSSAFLMMPPTSRLLYYDFGMLADDDGFCEYFGVMRMTEAKPDDLRVLEARGFVKVFDDKVLIIKDWKENNYIQKDRYTPSKYLQVFKKELKLLAQPQQKSCIQDVSSLDTQVRLGKVRLVEDNTSEHSSQEISDIIHLFEEINPTCKTYYGNKTQRKAVEFLISTYGFDKVSRIIKEVLPQTNGREFFPTITNPLQLRDKWSQLEVNYRSFISKKKSEQEKNGKIYW